MINANHAAEGNDKHLRRITKTLKGDYLGLRTIGAERRAGYRPISGV